MKRKVQCRNDRAEEIVKKKNFCKWMTDGGVYELSHKTIVRQWIVTDEMLMINSML